MKRIFLILFLVLVVIVFAGKNYYSANAKGFLNFKRCRSLKSPVSQSRLIETLGQPISVSDEGNTLKLLFDTPSVMLGKITALVDKRTGTTFCIKCCEESGCK